MPEGAGMKMNYIEKKLKRVDVSDTVKAQFEEMVSSLGKLLYKFEKINAVILFGSYARGDYSVRHSDLDIMIFLDENEKDIGLESKILKKIMEINLGKLVSIHTVFQYKSVKEEDSSLLLTISNEGKTLFARKSVVINDKILGLKSYHIIVFDTSGLDQVKKNRLHRFLHGYSANGKKVKGLIDGEKVFAAGKGAIVAPEETANKVILFADKVGIKSKRAGKFYK